MTITFDLVVSARS